MNVATSAGSASTWVGSVSPQAVIRAVTAAVSVGKARKSAQNELLQP